jgi:preprotein translocase subunit SecG
LTKLRLFATVCVLALVLTSCQTTGGFLGGLFGGGGESDVPKQTATGEILDETTSLMAELRWLLILALLFIPQAREAVGVFVKSLFTALALPFTRLVARFSPSSMPEELKPDADEKSTQDPAP